MKIVKKNMKIYNMYSIRLAFLSSLEASILSSLGTAPSNVLVGTVLFPQYSRIAGSFL
jgi:hypothetical protein